MTDIISAYRIGQASSEEKYIRPMVIKMSDTVVKLIIMENKGKLMKHPKFDKVFLNDDLPPELKKQRRTLREISKYARYLGYNSKASGSKLIIDNKTYRYETLYLLPTCVT